jgi:hypothetical protein
MTTTQRVLVGAEFLTVDSSNSVAEAVAVADGRILAVGSRDAVLARCDPDAEIIDLGGTCVLPGIVEPHTHPDLCAECYAWIDVSGFSHPSVEGVEAALSEAVTKAESGQWLFAFGLDAMLTSDLGVWNRERLDRLAPDNPLVVMIQSMHTLFVNSAALLAANINRDTPDPAGGGRYQRAADGELTGKCVEAPAMGPFLRFVDRSPETARSGIWDQYQRYARAGITTIGMPGLFSPLSTLDIFEDLSRREDVPIRNVAYLRHFQIDQAGRAPGEGSDTFRIQGVKLWYDGSPYSGTMLLDDPYLESRLCCCTLGIQSGTTGHANFEPAEMRELVSRFHGEGWQVLTHAQGDRGTREALDLYEHALGKNPRADHRWRLEHCALISKDDLVRAARLGVVPSFHVNHVHYYGSELRDHILGPERAEALMPISSAIKAGHRVSLHADSPMYPPEPFKLMATAITRASRSGDVLNPSEGIDPEQALRAITIDAAWQLFAEDRVGSIEMGKLADFTVVDRNPLRIPATELDELIVTETWLGGRRSVWS